MTVPETAGQTCATDAPLLSVIMPIYNIEKYVEASIASVLNQSYRNLELIIVDDASTDGSLALAHMFAKMDERVRVVALPHNTLGGAGIPSNVGLEHATGDFIAFLDGDDLLSPHAIAKLMQRAIEHDCDLTIGSFKNLVDDTKDVEKPYDVSTFSEIPKDRVLAPKDHPKALQISPVPWRKIYKKSFLNRHEIRFPEGDLFYEDNPLHWDVMTAAETMVFVPVTVVYHRINRRGQTIQSGSPKLGAYFQHFTAMSQRVEKNGAQFAWEPLLKCVDRARWIIDSQSDPALVGLFRKRFNQVLHEHIAPSLSQEQHSSLKRVVTRYDNSEPPADVSVVIYHDDQTASPFDLARSVSSAVPGDALTTEIIVLCRGQAPAAQPDWDRVVMFETQASLCRSFNQALPLCSGKYIAFLRSGDELLPDAVHHALENTAAELLRYTPASAQSELSARVSLYSRRLIQDNALFFGPTSNGQVGFEMLCGFFATSAMELSESPIKRSARSRAAVTAQDAEREAGYLMRRLRIASANKDEILAVLESVAATLQSSESALNAEEIYRLAEAKHLATDEISKANYVGHKASASHQAEKDYSGA